MRISQIKSFVRLVEIENFSKAADSLYISQSALSKHIAAIEEELDTKLLIRKSRGIELTNEGRLFLDFAKKVDLEYDNLLSNINKGNIKKVVMVVMPASLWVVSPILDKFTAEYPDIEVVLHEREQDEMLDAVSELNADIMLTWDNLIPQQGYTVIPLIPSLLCIGVGKTHPLSNVEKAPLYTMANQPFIMLHQKGIRKFLSKICRDSGFMPNIQHQVTTNDTMLRLIREGKGVGFLYAPANDIDLDFLKDIHIIKLTDPVKSALSLALPVGSVSQATQTFIEYVQKCCENYRA